MSIESKEKETTLTPETAATPTSASTPLASTTPVAATTPEPPATQQSPEEEIKEITKTGEVLVDKIKFILELLPKFWARILKLLKRFGKK